MGSWEKEGEKNLSGYHRRILELLDKRSANSMKACSKSERVGLVELKGLAGGAA